MISRARQAGPITEITATAVVVGFRILENQLKRLLQGTVLFPYVIYIYNIYIYIDLSPCCELSITTCSAHSVGDLSLFDAV